MPEMTEPYYVSMLKSHGFTPDPDDHQYGALGLCWKLSPEIGDGSYWTYGQKANTPSITVKLGKSDITASYDASSYTCTYYTDAGCTDMTTAADGAATNGGVPKNAGTYYVKVVVPENGN